MTRTHTHNTRLSHFARLICFQQQQQQIITIYTNRYGKHGDRWFNFDDRSVSVLHDDVIDPRSAYVLFWRRVKEEEGGAK